VRRTIDQAKNFTVTAHFIFVSEWRDKTKPSGFVLDRPVKQGAMEIVASR
jgi:hypothetical protein